MQLNRQARGPCGRQAEEPSEHWVVDWDCLVGQEDERIDAEVPEVGTLDAT